MRVSPLHVAVTSAGTGPTPSFRTSEGPVTRALLGRVRNHLGPLWGLTRMAPSFILGLRNAGIVLLMPLVQAHLQRHGQLLRVPLRVDGARRDFFVDCMGDLQVLYMIWGWRVYDIAPLAMANTVIDVGANIGAAVVFFKQRRPQAAIHAYEPDPDTFRKLERNVSDLPGVTLHRAAISAADGYVTLYSSPNSWDSSTVSGAGQRIEVRSLRLPTARREARMDQVDLLKINAEGAEFDIFEDPGALDGIGSIVAELHFDLVPGRTLKDVFDACSRFGATVRGDSAKRMLMVAIRAD